MRIKKVITNNLAQKSGENSPTDEISNDYDCYNEMSHLPHSGPLSFLTEEGLRDVRWYYFGMAFFRKTSMSTPSTAEKMDF